jgi:TRAP transporter TAXI family solute receptor
MLKLKLTALFCLLISSSAFANPIIGMPTGSNGGTYYPMGSDIAKLAASEGLNIDVKSSLGSLDNIRRMSSSENAGISIVQSDVIEYLGNTKSSVNKAVLKHLRLVFPLYNEEVHLLAKGGIVSIADLENKRVVVGKLGSGTFVTVSNILNKVGIKVVQIHDLSPKEAYQGLLLGKVDAVFFVGGKPISYINGLLEMKVDEKLSKLAEDIHLVPLDDERLYESYAKATITPMDYETSDRTARLTDVVVPTVAVKAVLVSHDFSIKNNGYYQMRCRQIDQLNNVVRNNLELLASGGAGGNEFHPKWEHVDLDQDVDLPRSACIKGIGRDVDEAKEIDCYLQTGKSCQ